MQFHLIMRTMLLLVTLTLAACNHHDSPPGIAADGSLVKLHYQNASGEAGLTTYDFDAMGN